MERFTELDNLTYDNAGMTKILKLTREEIESIMAESYEHFWFLCFVLKKRGEDEDFELIKKFINDSDHRKCYLALKNILAFEKGKEKYAHFVSERLKNDDIIILRGALELVREHKLMQTDNRILEIYEKYIDKNISSCCVCALRYNPGFEENYERILALYRRAPKPNKECFTKLLTDLADESHFDELFPLFAEDEYCKVRIGAARLAIKHERYELLNRFINEKDGHIRKLALKYSKNVT